MSSSAYQINRASDKERARTRDLLDLLPQGRSSVLDIGARDGHFSKLLAERFHSVTALDIVTPSFKDSRIEIVRGDITRLPFQDDSFDCVFCAEVLEHIPAVEKACSEVARVARYDIVIGVPFEQDIRVGRNTCRSCGKISPRWGHVNTFDQKRLRSLFSGLSVSAESLVGSNLDFTNSIAVFLMDVAGNPWGSYAQEEPCIHCGSKLRPPPPRALWKKVCSAAAARLNAIQALFMRSRPDWIHMVFSKREFRPHES
jgi:SAM-dependent methyltransferase